MDDCRYNNGFTLVEMVIVVAVIGLLTTMVIGVGGALHRQAQRRGAKSVLLQVEGAIDAYYEFKGSYPGPVVSTNAGANCEILYRELELVPGSRKILGLINDVLIRDDYNGAAGLFEIYDPWGEVLNYQYEAGTSYPVLISAGPDEKFGTDDDIRNK